MARLYLLTPDTTLAENIKVCLQTIFYVYHFTSLNYQIYMESKETTSMSIFNVFEELCCKINFSPTNTQLGKQKTNVAVSSQKNKILTFLPLKSISL